MGFKLAYENKLENKALRDFYVETMHQILQADENVVTMDADLMGSMGLQPVMEQFPQRVLNVGIQEANMIGMGAGMSNLGKKPYIHTFAAFASRRDFDQIFISGAYAGNPLKVIGSDPGICSKYNGGTHMPFEDIAMMRTIPGVAIFEVTDGTMFARVLKMVKDYPGVVYIRTDRLAAIKVYDSASTFEIGKGNVLKDGSDVTLIAAGFLVAEALKAAELLAKENISAAVIDIFSIKPIDRELITQYAQKTGAVVTAENHNINGGLGDAVAAVLSENCPTYLKKIAVDEAFGEVGSLEYLKECFGLNDTSIAAAAREAIAKKKSAIPPQVAGYVGNKRENL